MAGRAPVQATAGRANPSRDKERSCSISSSRRPRRRRHRPPWFRADVGIRGDRIAAVGTLGQAEARRRLDVGGKVVAPGFIDAHVHGDLALLADPLHEPAIRQGVTTYVIGQDGVAMAPASPATLDYMRRYTAGFSGRFDACRSRWSSMAEYLARFDRRAAPSTSPASCPTATSAWR